MMTNRLPCRRARSAWIPVLSWLLLVGTLFAAEERREPSAAAKLHELFQAEWEYTMEQNPTWASQLGDRRWNDRWPDLSLAAMERRHQHNQEVLERLAAIDRAELAPADQLNYELFRQQYERRVEEYPFHWHLVALNQRGGIQTEDELADSLRFTNVRDYEDWIARLGSFHEYMDQTIGLLQEGVRRRVVLPRIIMERVPKQIEAQVVSEAEASPFYKVFEEMPEDIPASDQARLRREAVAAIEASVLPSYRKLQTFFHAEYLPACYDDVGAWRMPRGEEMYAHFAGKFTTTDLTPRQIHEIGLSEVKRIRAEMEAIKERVGFEGTLVEFFEHLRTSPRFYFETGEQLLAAYRAMSKEIDPHMVRIFRTLPRMPYGVEPIPDKIAPDTTTAYYRRPAADGSRAGAYFVNLYKPETRPKYEMMALSLHEAVPGHHLQIALAMELGELPNFRRYGGFTAYVEGWGLYAEFLGEELGLYDDPYAKFGQLTYEMWRAIRLVVDTGMHALRWTREEAIQFFKDNAAKSEQDIVNEVDRYIAWPGQALAYKIGELKIKELRRRAEEALGDRFDVREFHDVVLRDGAVPLDVLEAKVNAWLESRRAAN